MGLVQAVHYFWYNNKPGPYLVQGEAVTRQDIHTYGGPDPNFENCAICQACEWLSRVKQKDLFESHVCPTSKECQALCEKQGNDLWTNLHRNHFFAVGCDADSDAPRGLVYFPPKRSARLWEIFNNRTCEYHMHNLRAQFAQASQINVVPIIPENCSEYDFMFMMNTGFRTLQERRPSIPLVLYCHDMWGDGFQEALDYLEPEYLLTPYPTAWTRRYNLSLHTKVRFFPLLAGTFYTRPNLSKKSLDLLVIGVMTTKHYIPRIQYDEQLNKLPSKYRVEYSHHVGCVSHDTCGPVLSRQHPSIEFTNQDPTVRFMNKWSEFLGTARYVTFGPCDPPYASEFLLMKYGECLGSGAIPIMPEVEDLNLLGVKPYVHYIPLGDVWDNNDDLMRYLDNYESYRYIAENAVAWYETNADRMLYDNFEDLIQEVTEFRYPKRLIC